MKPLGWVGVALIVLGAVILAMRGFSYTKERDEVSVGGIELAAERKGFIPPAVGWVAVIAGAALVFAGRARRA